MRVLVIEDDAETPPTSCAACTSTAMSPTMWPTGRTGW